MRKTLIGCGVAIALGVGLAIGSGAFAQFGVGPMIYQYQGPSLGAIWTATPQVGSTLTAGANYPCGASLGGSATQGLIVATGNCPVAIGNAATPNDLIVQGSYSGVDPAIMVSGDTNRNLVIAPAGTGTIVFGGGVVFDRKQLPVPMPIPVKYVSFIDPVSQHKYFIPAYQVQGY